MYSFRSPIGRVTCNDGTSLSIQANETAYCTPRDNDGPYTHFEIGFIELGETDRGIDLFQDYSDGDFPSDVYAYVPGGLIQEFIDLHGGVDIQATLNAILQAIPMRKIG